MTKIGHILLLLIVLGVATEGQCQALFDRTNFTSLYFPENRDRGFSVKASIVAFFTTGATDRNGFRLGASLTASQTIGDWIFSTGIDAYKAKQKFGIGTTFAGVEYYDSRFGASYLVNKYYQGAKQVSGMLGVKIDDFGLKFEDDILGLPFTNGVIYDRYRTAALEVRYKHYLAGVNVYTTEINGLTDSSPYNRKGTYVGGKQLSSPIYVGYTDRDLIIRCGLNSQAGGYLGQNLWHRRFFDTGDFESSEDRSLFLQMGTYQPYTLY